MRIPLLYSVCIIIILLLVFGATLLTKKIPLTYRLLISSFATSLCIFLEKFFATTFPSSTFSSPSRSCSQFWYVVFFFKWRNVLVLN